MDSVKLSPIKLSSTMKPSSTKVRSAQTTPVSTEIKESQDNTSTENVQEDTGTSTTKFNFYNVLLNPMVIHVVAELIVIGCITTYFYRKTRSMQDEIDQLKTKVASLNALIESVEDQGSAIQLIARTLESNGISLRKQQTQTPIQPASKPQTAQSKKQKTVSFTNSPNTQSNPSITTGLNATRPPRVGTSASASVTSIPSPQRVAAAVIYTSTSTVSTASVPKKTPSPSIVEVVDSPHVQSKLLDGIVDSNTDVGTSANTSTSSSESETEFHDSELDKELQHDYENMEATREQSPSFMDSPSIKCSNDDDDNETCSLISD